MSDKNSFLIYYELEEQTAEFSDAQLGQLLRAIFEFEKRDVVPAISDVAVKTAFRFVAAYLERNKAKYSDVRIKRQEAGKKGGAPRGNANAQKQAKQASANDNKQNKQMLQKQAKQADKDKGNVNVKDNDKDNVPVKDIEANASCAEPSAEADPSQCDGHVTVGDDCVTQRNRSTHIQYQKIADSFKAICTSLPGIKALSDARKKAIKKAAENLNGITFEEFFKKVEASNFLTGRSGNWGGCGFDWILKPANLTKIIEGNYDNRSTTSKSDDFSNPENYKNLSMDV